MPPFLTPKVIVSSLKEKIDAIVTQGDRLYLGTSTGNLHIYGLNEHHDGDLESHVELIETKKSLTRRAIEQLGFVKDINSLVVLSEMTVTLFPLPSFLPPTVLVKAKAAFSFAIHTSVQNITPESKSPRPDETDFSKARAIPVIVTQLIVGCRRKVEAPLPHSARVISFLDSDTVCFAYSPTEHAIFSIPTMTAVDISTPLPVTASATAMGAFSGLTGYMTLSLGAKAKPSAISVSDSEVFITKDNEGIFIGTDAKPSRPATIEWPSPPEDIAFVKPYIMSVLPANTVPLRSPERSISPPPATFIPTSVLQVRSSLSMHISQTIPFPFDAPESTPTTPVPNATIRLLTSTSSSRSPLYLVTTPTDRAAAISEGSSIWQFHMKLWAEQIDELIVEGHYADALALLDTLDETSLPDKIQRRTRIRALNAVSDFRAAKFDKAIDTFLELDLNPAKVVALYPESVSGRLTVPQERWIPLFGGPPPPPPSAPATVEDSSSVTSGEHHGSEGDQHGKSESGSNGGEKGMGGSAAELLDTITGGAAGPIRGRLQKTGLGMLLPTGKPKDDDTSSIVSSKRRLVVHDDLHKSVETLVRYLADRRPKLGAALEAVGITPQTQSHKISPLSEVSVEELFTLPNVPLSVLTPEQLLRFAQIVDTALYKSYLVIRPILLGSLCRLPNWCEISEVEEDLRARQKFAELRDLYHGKKMHSRALDLLRELSEKETDIELKLSPSISYLQKLGPEHIDQIFNSARWIFDQDVDMAFEIFTSEDVELPRQPVADFLESIDPRICARYLEYLIDERQEDSHEFHNRLAELYLKMTLSAKKRNDEKSKKEVYSKLLKFLDSNDRFGIDRLYGHLSTTDLFEARAILLGRLGRHDQALELYVYKLRDYLKAEEYCKRIYRPGTETSNVFLTLLRIYLRPTAMVSSDLLQPALDLIHRHNPRLDPAETLDLLPPLVSAEDVRAFLYEALRAPIFDTQVVRNISKARNDQLARRLMLLQTKRVKVTDSRICPQCHKRIGNSVIAIHTPHGEVTHYQCREPFSRRLKDMRR
ncbi:hypothetical protein BDQ17DRAFT_1350883 [Cyathus striatus]|nr:hypothetical protein BDQ17DRAFT_1350883 [Cyathus striatus]